MRKNYLRKEDNVKMSLIRLALLINSERILSYSVT
mgnify:FL=1